jgi:hypothetical protein
MRRRLLLLLLPATALLPLPGAGAAVTFENVQDGTLTMTSEPGDYIGQGGSYSFSTPGNIFFARSSQAGSTITVTVRPDPVDTVFWSLAFAAPAGQQLAPGTYTGAQRVVSRAPGAPGLDVSGDYRGCNTVAGSFTVLDAVYEPSGYVDSFHAVFEQHCEGMAPALRGEVQVTNPPPPPPISASLTIDATAQLTGRGAVALHGTISCSREPDPDWSSIILDVTEPTKSGDRLGYAAVSVPSCPTTPVPWSATVTPVDPKSPFVKGTATVHAVARLRDPFYGEFNGEYVDAASATATATFKEG